MFFLEILKQFRSKLRTTLSEKLVKQHLQVSQKIRVLSKGIWQRLKIHMVFFFSMATYGSKLELSGSRKRSREFPAKTYCPRKIQQKNANTCTYRCSLNEKRSHFNMVKIPPQILFLLGNSRTIPSVNYSDFSSDYAQKAA